MNNKEFLASLSKKSGYKLDDTQRMLRTTFGSVVDLIVEGESVSLSGLGTFDVKKRMERIINNPGTGQRMLVPPKLVVNFKPVSSIKEKMK